MTDIPEDRQTVEIPATVMATAAALIAANPHHKYSPEVLIGSAIMAERERCARKADASAEEAEGFAATVSLRSTSLEFLAYADRERAIAAAIRKGEA